MLIRPFVPHDLPRLTELPAQHKYVAVAEDAS